MEKKQIIQQALMQLNNYLKNNYSQASVGDYFSLDKHTAAEPLNADGLDNSAYPKISSGEAGLHYYLFVQPWAPQKDINALISQIKSSPKKVILFADFVNPVMAETLRRRSIPFVDCAGNLFIRNDRFNFFVKRNKRPQLKRARMRGRAFNTAGLKLIFAIFNQPQILQYSYRDISNKVNIALG
ncbi:MAG: hypothetical protein DRQ44_17965, partial [Gammaproteobacteria bacterium]